MKTLILVRHGEAGQNSNDHDRPLTNKGKSDSLKIAYQIKQHIPLIDVLYSSSSLRTSQTAEELNKVLDIKHFNSSKEIYLASYLKLLETTWGMGREYENCLIVAHNPGISDLHNYLTGERVGFSTAGCSVLKANISDWTDIQQGILKTYSKTALIS